MDSSQEGMVTLRGTDQVLGEPDMSGTADSLAKVTNIANNESASVYELRIEDRTVAGLLYAETGNRVTLLATSVFPEFRGKGLAGKLLGGVLEGGVGEHLDLVEPVHPDDAAGVLAVGAGFPTETGRPSRVAHSTFGKVDDLI